MKASLSAILVVAVFAAASCKGGSGGDATGSDTDTDQDTEAETDTHADENGPSGWVWANAGNPRIILFSRAADPQGHGEMYLMTRDGEIAQVLDNTHKNYNPSITRDGGRIAFHRFEVPGLFESMDLFMLDLSTHEETRLTDDDFATAIPKWNPDGTRIIYSSWRNYDEDSPVANVFALDLSDWTVAQITTGTGFEDNDPAWCGTDAIAFKSTRNTGIPFKEEIFIAGIDGTGIQRLSTTNECESGCFESDHDPRCSLDGQWVYFYRYEASRPWVEQNPQNWSEVYPVNVWRVNRQGEQHKLTSCEHFCANPVPAEDGRVLFIEKDFIVDQDGELIGSSARLMLMEPDGSIPRELLPASVYAEHAPTLEWFDW